MNHFLVIGAEMSPELPRDVFHLKVLIGKDILEVDGSPLSGETARRVAADLWHDIEPDLFADLGELVDRALDDSDTRYESLLQRLGMCTQHIYADTFARLRRHRYRYLSALISSAGNYSEEELMGVLRAISDYCQGK